MITSLKTHFLGLSRLSLELDDILSSISASMDGSLPENTASRQAEPLSAETPARIVGASRAIFGAEF
jgi:hypothetical protein